MAEAQTFTLDLPSISQLGNGKTQFGTRSFDLKSSHTFVLPLKGLTNIIEGINEMTDG